MTTVNYIGVLPNGMQVENTESTTSDGSWQLLLNDCRHLPYKTIEELQRAGFTVIEVGS